jgi:hypothetical protein
MRLGVHDRQALLEGGLDGVDTKTRVCAAVARVDDEQCASEEEAAVAGGGGGGGGGGRGPDGRRVVGGS